MNRRIAVCGLSLAWLFLAFSPVGAEEACKADVSAAIEREERDAEQVRVHFDLEFTTEIRCAQLTYDLTVQEMLPNLQWKSVRKSGQLKVHHGKAERKVVHVMSADLRLLGHEASIVTCIPCDVEE